MSALGYYHKLAGFSDPSKTFYVVQMLKGYGKIGGRLDSRLPITLPILHQLVGMAAHLNDSQYHIFQFRAMCSLAFYAFLRVGELTASNAGHTIQLHQITKLMSRSNKVEAIKVTFVNYKHSYNQAPFSLVISRQHTCCPVHAILSYIELRGNSSGPLFQALDGSPITRSVFTSRLAIILRLCGLDPSRYKGHSFRIGAASHAAEQGMSDAQIRAMGRWKSNAFLKYVRIQSITP